ncbi:cation diffusion facilitator family transporter [Isoalcanivorax indicus]|uniref:cation diffusion facilitator family transporter n=1 Tax=Isoalcanivorax indicus TaxID=2202653 RepID=UPI000DB94D24|nr:cation diffusion facilitator family transporter [Isoalcanivorax indicus]
MKTERGALMLSAAMALLLGVVGVTAALGSGSRAILLDGLFNLTYFLVAVITVRVGALAAGPDNERFPYGYAYFESLVNAGKGLLILGISGVALVDAVMTLLTGGREIAAGLAIVYASFATLACSATAWMMHRTRRHVRSPLVRADFENWLVNSLISAAVLGAFCLVPLFRWLGWTSLVPYVDAVLVLGVVLLCLSVPIRMASRAVMELLNRTPPASLAVPVRHAIEEALSNLPVQALYVRMVRPGRMLYVTVHVVLPQDYAVHTLAELDDAYRQVYAAVRRVHAVTVADVVFTADETLAAPMRLS